MEQLGFTNQEKRVNDRKSWRVFVAAVNALDELQSERKRRRKSNENYFKLIAFLWKFL